MTFICYVFIFVTASEVTVLTLLTSKIVEVVCRFFFCYFCVQSFVVNMHLYHSLPDVRRQESVVNSIQTEISDCEFSCGYGTA